MKIKRHDDILGLPWPSLFDAKDMEWFGQSQHNAERTFMATYHGC